MRTLPVRWDRAPPPRSVGRPGENARHSPSAAALRCFCSHWIDQCIQRTIEQTLLTKSNFGQRFTRVMADQLRLSRTAQKWSVLRERQHADDYRHLIERLTELRLEAGVTQVQLAKTLQTSQSVVSKIERGVIRIDLADLLDYLAAIDADPTNFVSEYVKWRSKRK